MAEKISSYESTEIIDDKEMVVNILVIGRVGMFYQTKDEQQSAIGIWKLETGKNYPVIEQQLEMELDGLKNLHPLTCCFFL